MLAERNAKIFFVGESSIVFYMDFLISPYILLSLGMRIDKRSYDFEYRIF